MELTGEFIFTDIVNGQFHTRFNVYGRNLGEDDD